MGVERYGDIHQAGSDSIVTGDVFFKLLHNNLLPKEEMIMKKNILFGIGLGTDDNETFNYTQFSPGVISNYNNNQSNYNNNSYEQNVYSNPMMAYQSGSQYPFDQNQTKRFPYGLLSYNN